MSARLDRFLNRLYHFVGGALFLSLCAFVSFTAGDWHWPYSVQANKVLTPIVQPGGVFKQTRIIDYRADCELHYERRLQSTVGEGRRVMLPDVDFDSPPWDRDGKPQTIETPIPIDFPCGAAMIVDSPSAACNWFQRTFRRQHRADALTPFEVACPRRPEASN